MSLEDFYFASQIAAALGIMLSLIFVGIQVRQSNGQARQHEAARRADATQAVHDNFANMYLTFGSNLEVAEVATKGLKDPNSLSDGENMVLLSGLMAGMSYMQSAYFKWRQGDLSDDLWRAWQNSNVSYFASPGGKRFWEGRKSNFAPEFVAYVEEHLLEQTLPENFAPWLENAPPHEAGADKDARA
ncbi:MAG: hypothetical protein Pars92KO_03810 [Parasphingorhabdus sp.]